MKINKVETERRVVFNSLTNDLKITVNMSLDILKYICGNLSIHCKTVTMNIQIITNLF